MTNRFEVRGDTAAIFLRRKDGSEMETVIDASDLELVSSYPGSWCVSVGTNRKGVQWRYVVQQGSIKGGAKRKTHWLHRVIARPMDNELVDHIDHDGLNNRRSNLRAVDAFLNQQNRRGAEANSRSGIRGVYFNREKKKWCARIQTFNKSNFLGWHPTAEQAAQAVNQFLAAKDAGEVCHR
jgi:hypothetical protein